ncbi:Spo0B domain-containing protein [Gracilibacillus sp. S3-1-1]|uniref:Spo0B domain-containing protein n=1 Tax=Gracilibacillus pellucidus TaxID=3095368 RepID=A0ACC6M6V7_9BACI|nr:Spo0B domain-containing protein [Gracilibacillus sp. S3-1-1]MDX8046552.1 Spo0B domain-containing protein [Gracilibacillus sp. S3-1-1]
MKEQDVVEMLRHYRHDWLNDLQLILGYAQMGKLDKIEQKINGVIERSDQERGLERLNIPKTMVWLYQLNWRSETFKLQFQSKVDTPIAIIDDDELLVKVQNIFHILPSYQKEYEEYAGTLIFKEVNHTIHITLTFGLNWTDMEALKQKLEELSFVNNVSTEDLLQIEWQE